MIAVFEVIGGKKTVVVAVEAAEVASFDVEIVGKVVASVVEVLLIEYGVAEAAEDVVVASEFCHKDYVDLDAEIARDFVAIVFEGQALVARESMAAVVFAGEQVVAAAKIVEE
ncbi:unnamed protein product [Wuchereria bancrofti]|uniref:Uncharacterized protein n=1 Tax=Wuchereria bancrofti TaxID=6293 RepID=A0A3P7FYT0_WUCBA|nr:unnamed protein product [Wuchereria bancrofti]